MRRIFIIFLLAMLATPVPALVLKEDTATTVTIGAFVDSTDGATVEAALTLSQADIQLSKNGGAFAQKNQASNATYGTAGMYRVPLDATDMNTPGVLSIAVAESGALVVFAHFQVVAANVYDSLYSTAAADLLDVNAAQWNGTAVATPATAGYPVVTLKVGTGTGEANVTGGKIPVTTVDTVNDKTSYTLSDAGRTALWTIPATRAITGGTIGTYTGNTPQTGDAYAAVAHVTYGLAALKTLIDAIEGQTDDLGIAGAGLTAVPWNAAWDAEVQSEVNDALVAFFTTAATLVDLIWDELKSGHTTAGTFGLYLDQAISSLQAGTGLTAQEVRDAMKLAPSAGTPTAGSVDAHLDAAALEATAGQILEGLQSR